MSAGARIGDGQANGTALPPVRRRGRGQGKAPPPIAAAESERVEALGEIGLQQFAPYLMNRIMGRYNATILSELRARKLTTAQMRALAVLAVADGLTVNELAVYTVTEQSTMSRTLDAMDAQGLVRRVAHDSDNRIRLIYLSATGRALFETLWPLMWQAFRAMFDGVGEAEYATFVAVLNKMLRNVRQHAF
jgi:DNA-binding MarR family transcriptional regulator